MIDVELPVRSLRSASLTAAVALTLMAGLAVFGNFVAVQSLVTTGDAAKTAADIAASQTLFRWGVACLVLVAVLDIVVAAALYSVFASVNRTVAMAAAWFRVGYAAVFVAAIGWLASVPARLDSPELVLAAADSFSAVWNLGLIVFAFHLLCIGWLAYRGPFISRVFGVLLVIAGLGYLIDGLGTLVFVDYSFQAAGYTFFGEIALIFWLYIKGPRTAVSE